MEESNSIRVCDIKEKYMTFFIPQTYSTSLQEIEIYDATRQFWYNVSQKTRTKNHDGTYEFAIALSIYDSVVIRVYTIIQWFDAGTTCSTRKHDKPENRYEFVGNLIESHPLIGKKLVESDGSDLRVNQQGWGYINNQ